MRFAALRAKWYPGYLIGGSLSMGGDHVEHAISYFVMWQQFHSPLLQGFAVVAHWVPFLIGSIPMGALADRFDCRRLVQLGQALFILVSVAWAALFATGALQPWHCVVLLILHGVAGVIWGPPEQRMLYDIAGPEALPSAVRLQTTGLNLGMLIGPAIGAALLALTGPALGMLLNVLMYLPLTLYLFVVPLTGHIRDGGALGAPLRAREVFAVIPELPRHPAILANVVLQGAVGLLVGVALVPFLPEFGTLLGVGEGGLGYGLLLVAMSVGAVAGGLGLEALGARTDTRVAIGAAIVFAVGIGVFALSPSFPLALAALVVAGAGSIVSASASQTVVQLDAPPDRRGRFIGAFGMAGNGFKAGSGLLLGILAGAIGPAAAFAATSAALAAVAAVLLAVVARRTT